MSRTAEKWSLVSNHHWGQATRAQWPASWHFCILFWFWGRALAGAAGLFFSAGSPDASSGAFSYLSSSSVRTPATGREHEGSCPSSTNILAILSRNFCSNLLGQRKTLDLGLTHPAQVRTLIRETVAHHPILHHIPLCKKYSDVQKYITQWRNHFLKSHSSGEWLSQGSYFNYYSRRQWEVCETKTEGKLLVSLSILKVAMQ